MVSCNGAPGSEPVLTEPGLLAGLHPDSGALRVSPPGGARNAASWPGMHGGVGGGVTRCPISAQTAQPHEPVRSPCQPRGHAVVDPGGGGSVLG